MFIAKNTVTTLICCCTLIIFVHSLEWPEKIKIGLIGNSFNAKTYELAASYAVSDLRYDTVIASNVTFE